MCAGGSSEMKPRLARAREHDQRAGIGQGVVGAGDAHIRYRAQIGAARFPQSARSARRPARGCRIRPGTARWKPPLACLLWRRPPRRAHRPEWLRGPPRRPGPPRAPAWMRCALRRWSPECGCAPAGASGMASPAARPSAVRTRLKNGLAGHQRRLHISRKERAGAGGRSRSSIQAFSGPSFIRPGTERIQPPRPGGATAEATLPAISYSRGCRMSQANRRNASFSQAPTPLARLGLLNFRAQLQQHLGQVDLHRTDFRAGPAQAGGEGQPRRVRGPQELRGENGADRPRVHPRKAVAADSAVHRAGVQAGPAANAVQRLALVAVG